MLKTQDKRLKGQALIMVTLSLVAMCGMLGLATDMGWAYFVKKSAQRAADSAAQAAANQAYTLVGEGTYACTNVTCQTSTSCAAAPNNPPATNIDSGCLYAKQNGFATGGNGGHQNVTIESNITTPAPTAPGIKVDYWATARVTESIPQLFSAVLQFPFATSSARATAAIVDVVVPGSLYLLDRENDPSPNGKGDDLHMGGGGGVTVAGATYMASAANGAGNKYAADQNGNASMTASYIGMRGAPSDPTAFTPGPATNQADGANYQDPMRGKGQPPPPIAADAPDTGGSAGGNLSAGGNGCTNLSPGTYYATAIVGGKKVATGAPLNLSGCINFTTGSGNFGNYVFYGGLNFNGGTFTFSPGRYIVAGALSGNSILSASNGTTATDNTPMVNGTSAPNNDAGEIFVFTNGTYTAQGRSLYAPAAVQAIQSNLQYSDVNIQMGNNAASYFNWHGLNPASGNVPDELKTFAPAVWWQDQGNSGILYNPDGTINTSCAGGSLNNPCANPNTKISPDVNFQAHPNTFLYGLWYQPRGASLNFQGHGGLNSPMMIISGSMSLQGSPVVLQPFTGTPLARKQVALVE